MANSFPSGNRSAYYRGRNNDPFANIRRNHRIKAESIRVISPEGKQLGVMPTSKALQLAGQFELDLVEVAPNAQPPVCRIMDFGKYMYEESKKTSHVKATASKIKEIELTARIDSHDLETKLRHAEEFLDEGAKVKMRLKFRGREMAHTEIGFAVMKKAIEDISGMGHPDNEPRLMGKQILVMITPHPINKRKPKFYHRPAPTQEGAPSAAHDAESAHAEA